MHVMGRFIVGGQIFWADRRILCCRSRDFERVLGNSSTGPAVGSGRADESSVHKDTVCNLEATISEGCWASSEPIEIPDISPRAFQALLGYLSADQLVVPPQQTELLLEL